MVVFDRPIGVQADAKELEYISALHQTGAHVRSNGSIRDEDIKAYLRSRFGIEVSLEEVRQTILQGLGGSDDEDEVIDLVELTAIILIPLLLKAAALEKGQELPPKCVPPPKHLLETGVQIILHDVAGEVNAQQKLSPEFVKRMLRVYGENDMANDDNLIQEMIHAANGSSNTSSGDFNVGTFAEALTGDVQLYDIENEVRLSTSIQDVFEQHRTSTDRSVPEHPQSGAGRQIETLKHIYTAPAIDIQAGTYRSKVLTLFLWGSTLFGIFTSAIRVKTNSTSNEDCVNAYYPEEGWVDNSAGMTCDVAYAIITWVVYFGLFAINGIFAMGVGSLGNYTGHTRWYLPLSASLWLICYYFLLAEIKGEQTTAYDRYVSVLAQAFTMLTAFLHLCHFVSIIFRDKVDFENSKWWVLRLLGGAPKIELHVKTAGAHKSAQLMNNATMLMQSQGDSSVFRTYFGLGLSTFMVKGVSTKETGGFFWLLRGLHDESIFEKEGIWYSTRLVASNCAQVLISLFILLLGISVVKQVKDNFGQEEAKAQMNAVVDYMIDTSLTADYQTEQATTELMIAVYNDTCINGVESGWMDIYTCAAFFDALVSSASNSSGYYNITSTIDATIQSLLQNALDSQIDSLYPDEEYMVILPLSIAVAIAVIMALRLAMLYLPGVTITILELRSGVIPSLQSPGFEKYRVAPDTVTMLTGSLFWGCLVSSILFGLVVGFVVFLFLWQGARYFMIKLVAIVISAICVVVIRFLVIHFCCRQRFYKGLYRTKPAASNISMLAVEWASFVFTSAFILVRMFKLLLIAVASIGKIDRRILADGIGQLGPLEFDPFPTIHLRDVVAHEAHRHPYIEILGTMYLMKLRYAKSFANRAGSAWRLIFVYALLPWMHQYRISEKDTAPNNDEVLQEPIDASLANHEERVMTTTDSPRLLPTLKNSVSMSSSVDMSALEIENLRLKQMVKKLRHQLGDVDE